MHIVMLPFVSNLHQISKKKKKGNLKKLLLYSALAYCKLCKNINVMVSMTWKKKLVEISCLHVTFVTIKP